MALSAAAIETLQRLVDQVQALSSVAETLTLRLLDLEERLQVQERAAVASRGTGLGSLAERRLADTEERLQGLEQMLATAPFSVAAEEALPSFAAGSAVDVPDPEDPEAALDGMAAGQPSEPDPVSDEEDGWHAEEEWSDQDRLIA